MTPQEQESLDRVFGRVHVRTGNGGYRPLVGMVPAPVIPKQEVSAAAQVKQTIVPIVAPRVETNPVLDALKRTLPTEAGVVSTTQKAAE